MSESQDIENRIILAEKVSGLIMIRDSRGNLVWPYIRMYFYYWYLGKNKEQLQKRHFFKYDYLKRIAIFFLMGSIWRLLFKKRKDVLIMSSQRYNNGTEIYTKDIKILLNGNYEEFSFTNNFKFERGPVYLDGMKVLFKLISYVFSPFIRIRSEVFHFQNLLNLDDSFIKLFRLYYFEYNLWYCFYSILFYFKKYKKVVLVGGVYYSPLIAVAEKRKVEVFELQHGIIHDLHLAYNFKNIYRSSFFANKLLLFSDYWKEACNFPIGTELVSVGCSQYRNVEVMRCERSSGLLFIGSPLDNQIFFEFLNKNIEFLIENGNVINFRLHPSDITLWKDKYPELVQWVKKGFVKVCEGELSISHQLSKNNKIGRAHV